ncbi:hypothetical protein A5662_18120 [Mycobacteriaceae bacterium 1482268.1]|nr:hypothetical protein A5662_18120 [Mycobacteriaceae bacterium 1482268.1]
MGRNDEQIADAENFIAGVTEAAIELLHRCGDFTHVRQEIKAEQLRTIIIRATQRALVDYEAAAKLSGLGLDAAAEAPAPYLYYVAVHAACGLIRDCRLMFPDTRPTMTATLDRLGASSYIQGCAFMLAIHIADRFADDIETPSLDSHRDITAQFLSTLDTLISNNNDHTHDQIRPVLVECLVRRAGLRDADSELHKMAASAAVEPVTPSALREDPASQQPPGAPPVGDHPERARGKPDRRKSVAVGLVVLVVGAVLGALITGTVQRDRQATVTPTTVTTTVTAPLPPPSGLEASLSAPTLTNVSMQLLAHPQGSQIDPTISAGPEHSTRARATMPMGGVLDVEIRLAVPKGVTPDPEEHFFIGFWPSGLMTLQPNTTKVLQPGHPAVDVNDLKPVPTTAVTALDPGGATTTYTLSVAAIPQPAVTGASPGSGYFCGYNTQAINAILVSSKYPTTQILTTLPVSVLRTTDCG